MFQPFVSAFTENFGYSYAYSLFTILYLICLIAIKFKPIEALEHDISQKANKE